MRPTKREQRGLPLRADVVVVGSGVAALAAALELRSRGTRVAVVPPGTGGPTSGGLGLALLGPGCPYARIARALGRGEARVLWAAGCENHLRLRSFLESVGSDCGYDARGSFLLATDRAQAEELEESEDLLRDDGFPGEFLDNYMLETHFDLTGFPGAYWAAEDAEVDSGLLLDALSERARSSGIVLVPDPARPPFVVDSSSVRVETEGAPVHAEAGLVATDGPAAGLLPTLDALLVGVAPGRLRAAVLAGARLPTAARTADGGLAWRCRAGEVVLSAARPGEAKGEERLLGLAERLPTDLASARRWDEPAEAGADGLPLVGRLPGRPLAVACGFGVFPTSLAFAAARWVSDALLTGRDPTPAALRVARTPAAV